MSSIGPQLPPSLPKRKRSTEDQGGVESPPAKVHAAGPQLPSNTDEIALGAESSDDDEYGPTMPQAAAEAPRQPTMGPSAPASIGPTLPPSNTNEIALDGSDDDGDYGPAAPASGPSIGPSGPPPAGPTLPPHATGQEERDADAGPAPAAPKRVHGPAPPPAPLSERPAASDDGSDDGSDDDYGPALPTSSAHQARQSEATARAARAAAESAARGPQRDDWMLAPPAAGGGYRAPDPTKLKARKFNSGPRSGGGSDAASGGGISSIWTETPEQKRKRLEDAVLGRGGADAAATAGPRPPPAKSHEEEERAAQIRDNIERARGPSLYAAHQARDGGKGGRIEEEEDDPSKRGFDREKDMKVGGRIGAAQRKELLNKAADFGGRFSKGKFL